MCKHIFQGDNFNNITNDSYWSKLENSLLSVSHWRVTAELRVSFSSVQSQLKVFAEAKDENTTRIEKKKNLSNKIALVNI